MKKLVVITGPTGVGKTKISIDIAKKFNMAIINADASQFRKNLDIGTSKITVSEMNGVVHYMLDFLEPLENYSIKEYQKDVRKLIDEKLIDQNILMVGGSGLYIDAVISNYDLQTNERNEENYVQYTNLQLWEKLNILNPELASKVHPNNRRRVIRYIEIAEDNGKISARKENIYDVLIICLMRDRKNLYDIINQRCDIMFTAGWIDECRNLINQGIDISLIKEIGYLEISNYLNNTMSLDEAKEVIKQKTRRYAKRQITWFKNKMNCNFITLDDKKTFDIIEEITKIINNFYGGKYGKN